MNLCSLPRLIQSLQNPAIYPHQTDAIEVIETHISWVLLTGLYAYKIKKPVNFGFLDFSTLKKRHFYCLEEIRKNSQLAPDIYLDVVAIGGDELHPKLNDTTNIFEYAVKMRQFTASHTFDKLLVDHRLQVHQLEQTARTVATFHEQASHAATTEPYGDPDIVMRPIRDNLLEIKQFEEKAMQNDTQQIAAWSEQTFIRLRAVLAERKHNGFIRECHGDLHLGNIALIDNHATPFDSIEFNPYLYWIDVISDIAFLVMDLEQRQRPDLAYAFLNEYLQLTGDYAGLAIMKFYQVYRAMVLAKVTAIRASQNNQQSIHLHKLLSYIEQANKYIQDAAPELIIMHGVSGSGKSCVSQQLLQRLPAIRIRSDIERKRLFLDSASPQTLYSTAITTQTYQYLLQLAKEVLNSGYKVIVDATFLLQQQRQPFQQLAADLGIDYTIIHTHAHVETLQQRLQTRRSDRHNISDATTEVLHQQFTQLEALTPEEQAHCYEIDTQNDADVAAFWSKANTLWLK